MQAMTMEATDSSSSDFVPLVLAPDPGSGPSISVPDPNHNIPLFTTGQLTPRSYTDEQLLAHIKGLATQDWALRRYIRGWSDVVDPLALHYLSLRELHHFSSSNFEIFEVHSKTSNLANVPTKVHETASCRESVVDLSTSWSASPLDLWQKLKTVNPSGTSAGRITILQEPTPLMLGTIDLTVRTNFDTDEVIRLLVDNKGGQYVGKTEARLLKRCYLPGPLSQRSFVFIFRYYTRVGDDLEPAPWQYCHRGGSVERSRYHIDLAECSSVLALSLDGHPVKRVNSEGPSRTRRNVHNGPNPTSATGFIYDTFAPWHLLHMQSFPDYLHSVMTPDNQGSSRFNGPHAFLFCLAQEYRDAAKRNNNLRTAITALVAPPVASLFDHKLHDKLLFEDPMMTYTRRYFWAFNTLRAINQSIDSLIAAYRDTFTDTVWSGRHPELWPHPAPDSPQADHYRSVLAPLRRDIERAIDELAVIQKKNEHTRQEITILREQLMAGSSIKESRRSIERGDNMKMLTSISVIFLPLTFVTSIFGMTEFHVKPSEWQFPAVMVLVCIPVILFVLLVQTVSGMGLVKRFVRDGLGFGVAGREDSYRGRYDYCVGDGWYVDGNTGRRPWSFWLWVWVMEGVYGKRDGVGTDGDSDSVGVSNSGTGRIGGGEQVVDGSKRGWWRWLR